MKDKRGLFAPWPTTPKKGWLPGEVDIGALTWRVDKEARQALLSLVDQCKAKGLGVEDITLDDFRHPVVDEGLARMERVMKYGPGLAFIADLPFDERPVDDIWMMYWGIGTHFGRAASQNRRGELRGEVKVQEGAVAGRAYSHAGGLTLHADRIDILSLFCIRKPLSGGENIFASTLKIWDICAAERPGIIPTLLRGFRQHRMGENLRLGDDATTYPVPVFSEVNGLRSTLFSGNAHLSHVKKYFADELTPEEEEALAFMEAVRDREELALRHTLDLGEAVFINNYELAHSRGAFTDGEDEAHKRRLLRLWLEAVPERPKPQAMDVMRNPSGRQGIDGWTEQRWAVERALKEPAE